MENGLYKVEFQTPLGAGAGVVFLQNGKIHGGDSAMFYVGQVSAQGDDLTAEVEGNLHTQAPGMQSVFGVNHTHINLKGKGAGKAANFTGTAKEAPGVTFKAKLTKLSD
jgi:T3SS negative regulator,GrlR